MNKIVLSLCCNLLTFYLTGLSNIWAHERAMNNKNIHPLQDLGFDLISQNNDYLFVNDYILFVTLGLTLLMVFFQKNRWEIIFRWSIMLNILFAMRVITVPSTVLTRPVELGKEWESCKTIGYDYNGLFGPFEMIFKQKYTCFDFIFSGHMVNTITCVLLLIKYSPIPKKISYFFWLFVVAESFAIIITRSHYLVDIEISLFLTILVWLVFEYREKVEELKQNYGIENNQVINYV